MVGRKVNVAKRLALMLAAAQMACGAARTGPGQSVAVEVSPPSADLYVQQSLGFDAAVIGTSATGVTWSIQEGAAGGSVTSGGQYTAPTSPGTYHVVATSTADARKSASATVRVTTAPPVVGAPMTTASRTTGVAPLAVFFDAADEVAGNVGGRITFDWTSGVYQPPDMEGAHWSWNFGDPGSGTWSTTGRSRNAATGYTAAHVFENPGTYDVSLTVTDTAGVARSYVQTITVTSFSGTTRWVAAGGTGDGTSPSSPWGSADTGLAWVAGRSNRRLLFNRGDTFSASARGISGVAGPGIIGAYGTGAKPVITSSVGTAGAAIDVSGGSDWRIMDLDLRPSGGPGTGWSALSAGGNARDVTYLRITANGWAVGLGGSDQGDAVDGLAVVDCEDGNTTPLTSTGAGGIAAYLSGRHLAILGNDIHDVQYDPSGKNGSHVLRVPWAHHGVISHNRLWNPGCVSGYPNDCRHALKLHSYEHDSYGDGPDTMWVSITDNLVRGKAWSVAIGPEDGGRDERITHVIYERNRHWGEATVGRDLMIWARNVIVRNNLFDGTGSGAYYAAVEVARRGIEPPPDDVRIVNNTAVRTSGGLEFYGVALSSVDTNVRVRNNLVAGPGSGIAAMITGAAGSGYVADHNLVNSSPGFTAPSRGDFTLQPDTPAVDQGAALPEVREDFLRQSRPQGGGYDRGCYESH